MDKLVYHYTDTARLPWILVAAELRPGRNRIAGFLDPDFLWATTSPLGDRSASGTSGGFRSGLTRMVRFVLRADDFEAWPQITKSFSAWTPAEIARLERGAEGISRPADWRCRAYALPRNAWVGIETRSYSDKTWRLFDPAAPSLVVVSGDTLGVAIGDKMYVSQQYKHATGATGYAVSVSVREKAA